MAEKRTTSTVVHRETKKLFLKKVKAPLVPNTSRKFCRVQVWGNRGGVFVKISVRSLKDMVKVQNMGKRNAAAAANRHNLKKSFLFYLS